MEELHKWHVEKCDAHPCFRRIDDAKALAEDAAVTAMLQDTEESKKVARLGGSKHFAVYERNELWAPAVDAVKESSTEDKNHSTFNSHMLKLWQ